MDYNPKTGHPIVRLRAFRAIDDPASCKLFLEGHEHVLTSIGVTKVTSSKDEWTRNPAAFVLIVESLDGTKVYGGARIHVAGGTQPLPIEQATGMMDDSVFDLVWKYAQNGTGEGCGLWNSREISGYGIGSIFLTRAGVAIAPQIGIKSLFALCAPYTVKLSESVGYRLEKSIGNNGTFYYPKLDLLATTMVLKDLENLNDTNEENRKAIFELRENLNCTRVEVLRNKEIEIHYDLVIPNMNKWNLDEIISKLHKNKPNITFYKEPINII
jgi:hypothetical protein